MQEKTLLLALSTNAVNIANMEAHLGHMKDKAMWYKDQGEMSFHFHECDKIARLRAKKNLAIQHQQAMKAELKEQRQRQGHIISLKASGIEFHASVYDSMTSYELEAFASVAREARIGRRKLERIVQLARAAQAKEEVPLAA